MTTGRIRLVLAAVLAFTTLGAGTRPAASPPLPYAAGESLEYLGRWQGLEAATARIAVAAGARAGTLKLSADAQVSPLVAAFLDSRFACEVEWDPSSQLPLRVRRISAERGKERVDEAVFDHARGQILVGGKRLPLEAKAQDPVSALYRLRTMRFGRLGSVQRMAVNDLGQPLDLDIEVADRRDGVLQLKLTSTERAGTRQQSVLRIALEESGRRRILSLATALPFGEVALELKK